MKSKIIQLIHILSGDPGFARAGFIKIESNKIHV